MTTSIDTTYEKQKILVESLLASPDLFMLCSNIISSAYFMPEFKNTVDFIQEYYGMYNSLPSIKVIKAETGVVLDVAEKLLLDEFDYAANEIESFCKEKAVLNEVLDAGKYIDSGDFGTLVERLEAAVLISLQRDLGTNVMDDVAARIESRKNSRQPISTGWPNVDKILGGGLQRTELLMCSANSGGGKSVMLGNLALNFVQQGHDVLYVSLELNEDMVSDRIETMITARGREEKFNRIAETATEVEQFSSENGATIYVKYMDAESNSNDIRAYLKEFELCYNKVPTLLIVDYLDIFGTNERQPFSSVYDKDKASSTQLRAIGNNPHYNMVMATASQQNRTAVNEVQMNHSHIAGGLSKINIVDIYLSIIMTDAMRAEGVADFAFLKTRSSGGVGESAHMSWDPIALKFDSLDRTSINTSVANTTARQPESTDKSSRNIVETGGELLSLMDFE